jgi:hypothetical protein
MMAETVAGSFFHRSLGGTGCLAMLCTTSGTNKFDVGENLDYSSAVSCAVDLFGPTDFTAPEMEGDVGAPGNAEHAEP